MTRPPKLAKPQILPLSLRVTMLIAINGVVVVGLILFLAVDYQRGLSGRLHDKQVALQEEATLLIHAVSALKHHGTEAVQAYIDQACAQMQETYSPGHHIAVDLDGLVMQARTHGRASDEMLAIMQGVSTESGRGVLQNETLLIGSAREGGLRAYVSEFARNVREAANAELLRRAGATALFVLLLAALINVLLLRLVSRPVERLVRAVQDIAAGNYPAEFPNLPNAELRFLGEALSRMSGSLADADRERQTQMDRAREIQENLLPRADDLHRIGLHHVHRPAEDVGGDYFDIRTLDENRVLICLGDVTGHGVPAAMGASMLKTLFQHAPNQITEPAELLAHMNRRFHAVTLAGDFATMFLGTLDRHRNVLRYASAGHEIGYLVRKDGPVEPLMPTGLILGIEPDAGYETTEVELRPGDTVVLLTDGLTETMSPAKALFGRKAVSYLLDNTRGLPVSELAERLLRQADAHRDGAPQADDISLTLLRL